MELMVLHARHHEGYMTIRSVIEYYTQQVDRVVENSVGSRRSGGCSSDNCSRKDSDSDGTVHACNRGGLELLEMYEIEQVPFLENFEEGHSVSEM